MPTMEITLERDLKLLKDLHEHKASGPDEVPAKILKLAADGVAPTLINTGGFSTMKFKHRSNSIRLAHCQYVSELQKRR